MIQGASREQKLTTDNETLNGKIYTDYESKASLTSYSSQKVKPMSPPRLLDDDDQIRHTVFRPATSKKTKRQSAIIADNGEQEDFVDYRPTITGWNDASKQPLQSNPDPLREESVLSSSSSGVSVERLMAGQIDRSRELMSSDRLSVSLSKNSSDSALSNNINTPTTTIAPIAESDVTLENDEIVKGLNFSREFYRRNSQQKDEQQSYSSDVTSLHSDGIPATLNYVFRDKTTDDPTSDTKSERDQTEVADVQSVTTVPTTPPLITSNEQTSNTYVDYVRDSIFASFWGQKREQPSQSDICSTDQSLREDVRRSRISLDMSTSELHSQNSLQSDSIEKTSNTWLSNIVETSDQVDKNDNSECDKTTWESNVYPSTTNNNCQKKSLSTERVAPLPTENIIKRTVITSAEETETIDGKYASETSVGPGSYQQVMESQSKFDTFTKTKQIGRPLSENTISGHFCQGIISDALSTVKKTYKNDCSTSNSISSTTSATVIEQNKISTNVSTTNSSTSLASCKSSHSEHVPKPAFDDDDFIRHTVFKPKTLTKVKSRALDDDDQTRHTVCRPINTNNTNYNITNRPSAIVADGGEKEDYADYRPTITGWDGAPQITLQSDRPDAGLKEEEEDEKWYDPSSDSDADEFDPESIVADNDLQATVVTKRTASKVSNISLPDEDMIESVGPGQQRMSVVEVMAHTYRTSSISRPLSFSPSSTVVLDSKSATKSQTKTILNNVKFLQEQLVREKEHLVQIREHQARLKEKHRKKLEKTTGKLNYVRTSIRERVDTLRAMFG